MLRALERRPGGLVALLACCLSAGSGCKPSTGSDGKPPTLNVKVSDSGSKHESGSNDPDRKAPGSKGPDGKTLPQEFAGNFLKALSEGSADAEWLTLSFKKKIARPEFKDEAQQKLGYNPRKVDEFLQKAAAGKPLMTLKMGHVASNPIFVGTSKTADGRTESWLIRLAPSGDPEHWKVDWFQRTTAKGPALDEHAPGPEIVVHEFLGNLLGGDLTLAEAVMSSSLKGDLAWSATESNKDKGYDSAILKQKMGDWKKGLVDFTIAKREMSSGKPAVFEGELTDAAGKATKSYTMKLVQAAGDGWQVEEFKIN